MKYAFLFCILCFSTNSIGDEINVAVFGDHHVIIDEFNKQGQCPKIESFDFGDNQMLAEFLILCNALQLANLKSEIKLVPYPVATRVLAAIAKGDVHMSGFGVWQEEATEQKLATSKQLLGKNEFTKGLYTRRELSIKYRDFDKVNTSDLIAVANQNWKKDWQALKCTGLNLLHVNQYHQMFNLVNIGRAEMLPLTFGVHEDLERNVFNIALYPINGVKIVFEDSLHFAINTQTEKGKRLLTALNIGLSKLAKSGVINDVYQRLGITNLKTKSWRKLGC